MKPKRVLVAAGGTGGHLFPAQALAEGLLKREKGIEVLFAGKGLALNKYFYRDLFSFRDIESATPFGGQLRGVFRSIRGIVRGLKQSFAILKEFQPDLVVGFGSYHTFPLLLAALIKNIPIALFEPNSIPGKVNRLFSRFSILSAVQFAEATQYMSGRIVEVSIPLWQRGGVKRAHVGSSREYFQLDPERVTLLVFGGSQGAASINKVVSKVLEKGIARKDLQVVHITGNVAAKQEVEDCYRQIGLLACVKDFETRMDHAWRAADFAICRSGAATLGELIAFEVPAILIPFPKAADDHQTKNALFLQNQVRGGIHLSEEDLSEESLVMALEKMLSSNATEMRSMKESIRTFKVQAQKGDLCSLICEVLYGK
jgi:UDP-N-acetylglucosamine--N-acetylmuramyl-(pentapeptide) pyrophosphoryl-undecaprenol N-acetylglucosamine transferase